MSIQKSDKNSGSAKVGGGLTTPLLLAAPNAGKAARGAVRLGVEAFGTAGTGVRIAALKGIAKSNAALAAIGGGPKVLGGLGVDGGNARLRVIGGAATALAVGAVLAGTFCLHKLTRPGDQRDAAAVAHRP
jgi:hypothetical protein